MALLLHHGRHLKDMLDRRPTWLGMLDRARTRCESNLIAVYGNASFGRHDKPLLICRWAFDHSEKPTSLTVSTSATYRAYSTTRISRMTVTLICPGYCNSFSIFRAISLESQKACSSLILSLSTMIRISRPACKA